MTDGRGDAPLWKTDPPSQLSTLKARVHQSLRPMPSRKIQVGEMPTANIDDTLAKQHEKKHAHPHEAPDEGTGAQSPDGGVSVARLMAVWRKYRGSGPPPDDPGSTTARAENFPFCNMLDIRNAI